MEAVLLVAGDLTGGVEQTQEQLTEVIGPDAVEVMLALAAGLDQAGDPQQRQVGADRRLALPPPVGEGGGRPLAVGGGRQVEQEWATAPLAQARYNLSE